MSKRKRRYFTEEQKADAVRLARESDKQPGAVARDLGIPGSSLRGWIKQAEIDDGKGPEGALTTAEKAEIRRLRREVKRLTQERDFLKKAAAYFAKDESENSK